MKLPDTPLTCRTAWVTRPREIERRLLPRYREALAAALAEQEKLDAMRATIHTQAQELAALLREQVNLHGSEWQPLLTSYHNHASVRIQVGRSSHRLELSLPHEQAVAVVELLREMWAAG